MTMLFENNDIGQNDEAGENDEQRGGRQRCILYDEDYTDENRTYNRVKNYSFARI